MKYPSKLMGLASLVVGLGALGKGLYTTHEVDSKYHPPITQEARTYREAEIDCANATRFEEGLNHHLGVGTRARIYVASALDNAIGLDRQDMEKNQAAYDAWNTESKKSYEGLDNALFLSLLGTGCLIISGTYYVNSRKKKKSEQRQRGEWDH